MQASTLFDLYQRQLEAMQSLASASLSGFERAHQAALTGCREMLSHQADLAGRVSDQAASIAMDPERVRPALDGIMEAQRDLLTAVNETQRRCMEALTPRVDAQDGAAYFDGVRQSIDQWQRFTEQWMNATREQTERLMSEGVQRTREMQDASSHAVRQTAGALQDTTKRTEESLQQGGSPRRGQEATRGGQKVGELNS